jgi:hypothetical protein
LKCGCLSFWPCKGREHVLMKCWYLSIIPLSITSQKTVTSWFSVSAMKFQLTLAVYVLLRKLRFLISVLQYEPNNATAKEFYPLIVEKLQLSEYCLLCYKSSASWRWSLKLKNWGYDNVLLGQGCHTLQGTAIDESRFSQ